MPLTKKGQHILSSMRKTYGSEKKAKSVFYASINAKKIHGAEKGRAEGGSVHPCPECGMHHEPGHPHMQNRAEGGRVTSYMRARGGPVRPEADDDDQRSMPQNFYRPSEGVWTYPESKPLERLGEPIPARSRYYRDMRARGGRVDGHEAREKELLGKLMRMQGHRAHGGSTGDGAYMVGERGPEMFVPDRPGTIIPHHEIRRLVKKYGGGRVSHMRKR
jgi:hypothetical protein